MMKKTVLKKVLKYAPVRSDFVRGTVADESVQNMEKDDDGNINVIQADYEEVIVEEETVTVDGTTGEVIENSSVQA